MHAVVTGANGFIGRAICAALLARGDATTGVVRRQAALAALPTGATPLLLPDYTDAAALLAHLPKAQCLIHAAGSASVSGPHLGAGPHADVETPRALARAAAALGYQRFVFISSIAVLGTEDGGTPFSEATPAAPGWPYASIKLQAEEALLEIGRTTGMEVVILRPPMVYGAGNRGNFPRLMRWVASGLPLPLLRAEQARSYIHVGNLADAAALCAHHPAAADRLFLVADDRDWTTPALVRLIAAEMRKPARLWPMPLPLLRLAGRLTGKSHEIGSLINGRRIDASLLRNTTGWAPPYAAEESLARTVQWFLQADPRETR